MTKSRGLRVRRGSRQIWLSENQGKHLCGCGCGAPIPLRVEHFNTGVPKFLHGHNSRAAPPNPRKPKVQKSCECGCGELASSGMRYISGHNRRGQHHSQATKDRLAVSNGGENNWNWGGRSTTFKGRIGHGDGYIRLWCDDHPFASAMGRRGGGYVMEHRLVVEEHLRETNPRSPHLTEVDGALYLSPETHVHHIDGVKDNNAVENLQPMTKAEHTALHARHRHRR